MGGGRQGSVYFNKGIEVHLAAIPSKLPVCSLTHCTYTHMSRELEPDNVNVNVQRHEGVTFHNERDNHSSATELAMLALPDEPKTVAKALAREDNGATEW